MKAYLVTAYAGFLALRAVLQNCPHISGTNSSLMATERRKNYSRLEEFILYSPRTATIAKPDPCHRFQSEKTVCSWYGLKPSSLEEEQEQFRLAVLDSTHLASAPVPSNDNSVMNEKQRDQDQKTLQSAAQALLQLREWSVSDSDN